MSISAKIILDSVSPRNVRLTTFELRYPRFFHQEVMTHRVISRNASSSRAIPLKKMLEAVETDPAMPIWWGKNQAGMQAREELTGEALEQAKKGWLEARDAAVAWARRLGDLNLHKQLVNRIIEPWSHITVVCSGTDWGNFYNLRNHTDAQPEFEELAGKMLEVHNDHSKLKRLEWDEWHLPYLKEEEYNQPLEILQKLSVARCARVSYLNHDKSEPDQPKDIGLFDDLLSSGHMSPFEHQATPLMDYEFSGNFQGWKQLRKTLKNENRSKYEGLREI